LQTDFLAASVGARPSKAPSEVVRLKKEVKRLREVQASLGETVAELKKRVAVLTARSEFACVSTTAPVTTSVLVENPQSSEVAVSGAASALAALRKRLNVGDPPAAQAVSAAEVSEAIKSEWIASGQLIGWSDLSDAWGKRSRQSLDQAAQRFELINLKVKGKLWYPAAFMDLSADAVKDVCLAMKNVDPVSKVIFWMRSHGALEGKTLAQAIKSGQLSRVIQLAEAFAEEFTGHVAHT
jgi:hypothetical protein